MEEVEKLKWGGGDGFRFEEAVCDGGAKIEKKTDNVEKNTILLVVAEVKVFEREGGSL